MSFTAYEFDVEVKSAEQRSNLLSKMLETARTHSREVGRGCWSAVEGIAINQDVSIVCLHTQHHPVC